MKTLAVSILCLAAVALADDFKTIDGKEYNNAKVTRVEPDGIVLITTSGVSKVYFTELPKEVQERFHYDAAKATAFSAEHNANLEAFRKQLDEAQRQAKEEAQRQAAERTAKIINPRPSKLKRAQSNLTISPAKNDGLRIEHESYEKLLSEAKTKATNLNYDQNRTDALISSIPAGGNLVLHIERSTIGAANTEYFTMIVLDRTGKEILRRVGSDSIAEVPGENGMWWNIMIMSLPEISETPIKIRVVDTLSNKASEFNAE